MKQSKYSHAFLELVRAYQVPSVLSNKVKSDEALANPKKSFEVGEASGKLDAPRRSLHSGVANNLGSPQQSSFQSSTHEAPKPATVFRKPEVTTVTIFVVNPPRVLYSKAFKSDSPVPDSEVFVPPPTPEQIPPNLAGAAVAGEIPLHLDAGSIYPESNTFQIGKTGSQSFIDSSIVSSLGLLLNKAFSLSGPALTNLMQTLVNNHLQLQSPALGLASAETLLQQAPLQAKTANITPSTIKSFVESVAHQVSFALSMTISHGAQLNPTQALNLALAKSLNLSAEQTSKLLGQIQSATAGQLSAATGEQARLVNPFIQGMVLNDPSAMKGFMAQLFSPVLKSLMGLLFTKELPFSYFPSNLLTELGGLMARSAQRKRNRPQRKRVGKSDRVSRKGSIYVEVDLEDEGFEPEEETDWWERFYNPEEAQAFLWN